MAAWLETNRPAIKRTVATGAAGRLSSAASAKLPGIVRVGGYDYALNAARLNARYYKTTATSTMRPVVTTAGSTVQYLVAATYAARRGQPVVPVWGRKMPVRSREWITNRRARIAGFEILTNGSVPYLMDRTLAKSDAL